MRAPASSLRLALGLALAAAVAGWSALPAAQTPPAPVVAPAAVAAPGDLVDPVVCRRAPDQSYALYLPTSWSPEKPAPILYLFDPRQGGRTAAELFRAAAEQLGVIVASSNNSRSDEAVDPNPAAMRAVWEDTHERFRIDPRRVYAAGFSGTARAAVVLATARSGEVAGVIGVGAGYPDGWKPTPGTPFAYYGLAAEWDFNFTEHLALDRALAELGIEHAFDSFPGTHAWPPAELCGDALAWLETLAMRRGHRAPDERHLDARLRAGRERAAALAAAGDLAGAARRYESLIAELGALRDVGAEAAALERLRASNEFRAEAEREREAAAEFDRYVRAARTELSTALRLPAEQWWLPDVRRRLELARLEKLAAKSPSLATRRGARQSLEALFVQTYFYLPRELAAKGNHVGAARCYEIALAIHPDEPILWYRLAQQRARLDERRSALDALREAVARGFTDAALLATDEAFAALRGEKAFRELLARLDERPGAAGAAP